MRRVVFNQKGGVGKSSIAVNLAAASAKSGFKTLLIDLDVQGNSTHYIVGEQSERLPGVEDFFQNQLSLYSREPMTSLIHQSAYPNLSVMPSGRGLLELEHKLESRYKMYKLKEALAELMTDFDRIYLDTPPALNFFSRSAMIAADRVVVPFDCDTFSKQALYQLTETIEEIKADHNPQLVLEAIVPNQVPARAKLPKQLIEGLKMDSLPVTKTTLSSSVVMRESHEKAKPLVYLHAKHRLTQEFEALLQELESQS
ncbi:ParA family protein [Litoricolaceae bacterium]|nr:ParA family protein [Litorivicinaceae bacterium]MDC1076461.1 ParA family protein [Litorivicinus sp.]